jgi:hypothetical protein
MVGVNRVNVAMGLVKRKIHHILFLRQVATY